MKELSPEMEICRVSRSHDVAWLAELDWDSGTGRYSSRPVGVGGIAYQPIVAAIDGLELAMPPMAAGPGGGSVKVELINTAEQGDERFEIRGETERLEGRTVRLGFVFLDPEVVLEPGDVVWVQTYQVEQVILGMAKAVLALRESPASAGRRLVGRTLLPTLDPNLSRAAVGRMIPLIFGWIERSPLIPFRVGRRGCLRVALEPEDTVVAVEDTAVFPDTGLVQIGDELIAYNSVDRTGHTLGRADSPVGRTAAAHHRAGSTVYWIPENGFEYLVADHPCRAVGPIYAGERVMDPAGYTAAVERIGGREVQKVIFPTLPTEVAYGSARQLRRIDGREDETLWGVGAGNGAESPLAAVDPADQTSAAVLDTSHTPLEVEYLGDLTAGLSIYGAMERCRLTVAFSASQRWSIDNDIRVTVGRGDASVSFVLHRPPLSENVATLPSHAHGDTIRDQVSDTRELFEFAEQIQTVDFEEATATGRWSGTEHAIDGNLGSWCQNTSAGGGAETAPLVLRLVRPPLGGEAVELAGLALHARLATDEPETVLAALDASIAGKFVDSWTVGVGSASQTFECVIPVSNLAIEDLTATATEFAVRSVDGRQIKLAGAWLRVRYRPKISGRERAARQVRTGAVEAAGPLPVPLPTKIYRQEFELTEFVQSHGGWGFFAAPSGARPFVRVRFGSTSDPTRLRISAIGFEVEYRPRTGVEVFERFEAEVEGVEQSGELVENPADVIEWLVTQEAGLGWGGEAIDSASFAAARTWLAARNWRLSRRLGVPLPIESLLEEIARESGCRLVWEAGRFRLLRLPTVLLAADAVAALDASVILSAGAAKRATPLGKIMNVVRLCYGAGYGLDGGERRAGRARWIEAEDAGSTALCWGRREGEMRAHWHASSPAELATRLAAVVLAQTSQPQLLVEVDVPLSQSHLERGDVVIVEHPSLRLDGTVGEVVAFAVVDGRGARVTVALQALAAYCWYGDAETFIAHLAGHSEKVFVVEGERVASLDRSGLLRLGAELVEQGLAPRSMAEAIEHDPDTHCLYFGVGSEAAGYSAVAAVDGEGRLWLRGTVRDRVDLSSLTIDQCHRAEPTRFLFSCDLTTVLFDYEASDDRLDLAGSVVENALL